MVKALIEEIETGRRFELTFGSPFLFDKYKKKCKHSKKVRIISWETLW